MASINTFLHAASSELAGLSPSPRCDVEIMVMRVCSLSRSTLITQADNALTSDQEAQLQELVARRKHGEPIAYLVGSREFWSLDLLVSPATLIPRPETELLVEIALTRIPPTTSPSGLSDIRQNAPLAIADLGTGSGAIALALASERPNCRIIATDISETALTVARANAQRHGLSQVQFRQGNWLAAVAGERLDLIVSNPPYVANGDQHLRQGDVAWEPRSALQGGPDGLDEIRKIAFQAKQALVPGGILLLEHGHDQARAVRALMTRYGYKNLYTHQDYARLDRVTEGRLAFEQTT